MELSAFGIGMHTKSPVEMSVLLRGLQTLGTHYPELIDARYDEQDKQFVLRDEQEDVTRQRLFRGTGTAFDFAWGSLVDIDVATVAPTFVRALKEAFGLVPINVNLIDFRCVTASQWPGNHWHAIFKTFFSQSPLGRSFDDDQNLQNDLTIRRTVAVPDTRAVMSVNSTLSDEKLLKRDFSDIYLRAYVGIGNTKVPVSADLEALAVQNMHLGLRFLDEEFIPSVVMPLDATLQQLSATAAEATRS